MNNDLSVELLKQTYKAGTRVQLIKTNDTSIILESGLYGTVIEVDDIGTLHVQWDNGKQLGLIQNIDFWIYLK